LGLLFISRHTSGKLTPDFPVSIQIVGNRHPLFASHCFCSSTLFFLHFKSFSILLPKYYDYRFSTQTVHTFVQITQTIIPNASTHTSVMHSQASVLVSLLALTTTTLAQSTVQKLFFPATNDDAWAGRVVNVGSGLTTYAIACTSGGLSCVTGVSVQFFPVPSLNPLPINGDRRYP
jgi:hypothetical protein